MLNQEKHNNIEAEKDSKSLLRLVLVFYSKITSWVMFPLILAIVLNRYLAGNQTSFFLAVLFAFVITCYGIYREIKEYKKNLDNGK